MQLRTLLTNLLGEKITIICYQGLESMIKNAAMMYAQIVFLDNKMKHVNIYLTNLNTFSLDLCKCFPTFPYITYYVHFLFHSTLAYVFRSQDLKKISDISTVSHFNAFWFSLRKFLAKQSIMMSEAQKKSLRKNTQIRL